MSIGRAMKPKMAEIEEGPCGPRLVLTGAWTSEHGMYMREHQIEDLYLNYARGWKGSNLNFLQELRWLKGFTILDWNIKDVSPVHHLKDLRLLEVSTYCNTELRFESFPELIDCRITWRKRARSLFDSKSIRRLFVSDYKDATTPMAFGMMTQLESLSIAGGSIETLSGLGLIRGLTFLGLYNLPRLRSLDGLESLVMLETLEVNDCRALSGIGAIKSLMHLRRLELNDDGPIQSFRPVGELQELREFFFVGTTKVVDGDLSPLDLLPRLEKISFQDRQHYNRSREQLAR